MVYTRDVMFRVRGEIPVAPTSLDEALELQNLFMVTRAQMYREQFARTGRGVGRPSLWGDSEDKLTRKVAGMTVHKDVMEALASVDGTYDSKLSATLLGLLWNPKLLSGQWKFSGFRLNRSCENIALAILPISDTALQILVLNSRWFVSPHGDRFRWYLSRVPHRPFLPPEQLTTMAALAGYSLEAGAVNYDLNA